MARSRLLAALAVALTLAVPSTALADSAGDQQYQDPFAGSPPTQKPSQPKTTTPAPAPTPAPAQTTPAAGSQPQQASQPTATTAQGATGQLPRTGLDLRVLGGAGLLLVVAGLVLRQRLA